MITDYELYISWIYSYEKLINYIKNIVTFNINKKSKQVFPKYGPSLQEARFHMTDYSTTVQGTDGANENGNIPCGNTPNKQ